MDKAMTKRVWLHNGLSTPDFVMLAADSDWDAIAKRLGLPLIVKPAHEGSTLGLTKVTTVDALPQAYAQAAKFDKAVMAEIFISGMELTCPVLGAGENARALPVVRIVAPDANYDYQNKYFSDETKYLCPSELPSAQEQQIQQLVLESYRTLGCRGWARADVMVNAKDNQPYLLEINTSPGMTSHSLVPMSAAAAGMSYEELCVELLRMAALDLQPSPDWKV
jgi:D-alanine-D-alanine ligase